MSRQRRLNKRLDDLFPQATASACRVCGEEVVDARWSYCSERCRSIATAVQKKYTWTTVRQKIIERDGYTCQKCGVTNTDPPDNFFHVDHIERIADDGHPLDERNLHTLCADCHKTKTAEENGTQKPAITLDEYLATGEQVPDESSHQAERTETMCYGTFEKRHPGEPMLVVDTVDGQMYRCPECGTMVDATEAGGDAVSDQL